MIGFKRFIVSFIIICVELGSLLHVCTGTNFTYKIQNKCDKTQCCCISDKLTLDVDGSDTATGLVSTDGKLCVANSSTIMIHNISSAGTAHIPNFANITIWNSGATFQILIEHAGMNDTYEQTCRMEFQQEGFTTSTRSGASIKTVATTSKSNNGGSIQQSTTSTTKKPTKPSSSNIIEIDLNIIFVSFLSSILAAIIY